VFAGGERGLRGRNEKNEKICPEHTEGAYWVARGRARIIPKEAFLQMETARTVPAKGGGDDWGLRKKEKLKSPYLRSQGPSMLEQRQTADERCRPHIGENRIEDGHVEDKIS